MASDPTIVYTDGACLGNPGPGGWAWAVPGGAFASGPEPATTNQRMELTAVLEALRALPGRVVVISDSSYVVNCFRDRWYEGWERKGWKNAKREPVANQDLWRPLVALVRARGDDITLRWVKGHSGDAMNDLVDRLAVEAAETQAARSGSQPPTQLGRADAPARRRITASEHRLIVLGHRPPQLGGYGDNPVARDVTRRLTERVEALRDVHGGLVMFTGLGLGAEQLGAEAAAAAGVPFTAVLAFPDPDAVWPAASRERFRALLARAADTIVLSPAAPPSKQAAGIALRRRDAWLVDHADGALVVWDRADRDLGALVAELERKLPDDVWVVPPQA